MLYVDGRIYSMQHVGGFVGLAGRVLEWLLQRVVCAADRKGVLVHATVDQVALPLVVQSSCSSGTRAELIPDVQPAPPVSSLHALGQGRARRYAYAPGKRFASAEGDDFSPVVPGTSPVAQKGV
jgi:hypothetical protein